MTETTSTPEGTSVNAVDQIADLLSGSDDQTEATTKREDEDDPDTGESTSEGEGEGVEAGSSADGEDLSWSAALGVDDHQIVVDDEGNLTGLQVKVDGETSTVSVKDLIAGYQLNKHVTQKSQALSEEKRNFDAIRANAIQDYQGKLQVLERTQAALEHALLRDFQSVDWDALRQSNPGEYSAMLTDLQSRKAQIEQLKAGVSQEASQAQMYQQHMAQEQMQQYLGAQYEATLAANPQWQDRDRMAKDMSEMVDTISKAYNLPPEALNGVTESWQIEMMKDLAAFHRGKGVADKKLQQAPAKYLKGKTPRPMSKATQLALNARKATGAKQRDIQADAVAALLMGQ